jgi:glycosyltransferase involved in cell wall biosynthesis
VNIAILIGRFPPHDVGGAERQADRWAAWLAARGHHVTVITRRWPGRQARETRDGFTIVRTPIAFAGPLRTLFDLGATMLAYRRIQPRPHLTLAFQTFASGWIASFLDVFQRVHSVVWVRGENEYRFDRHPALEGPSLFAWRQARRVLVQSEGHRERLLAQVARRDPFRAERLAQRVMVVGNGVDLPAAPIAGGADWLFVGRLIAHKGVDTLLEAVAALPAGERRPLWIVGDGPARVALEAEARRLGVDARFAGVQSRDALPGYYAKARAIVLPSTEGEGLPNALLEAMAYGIPAVATALPGASEIVGAGGRIVPVGDAPALGAALVALDDPAVHDAAAVEARRVAESFAWDVVGARLEAVLAEVAVRNPRVWIVSPNPTSRGGIAAVARQIATSRLSRRYRISMLPTYAPGSMLQRTWRGGVGILQVGAMILVRRPDLVHVKVASGGSFLRKVTVGAICRVRRVPVLAHVHGGGFDRFMKTAPGWVAGIARWWFAGTAEVLTLSDRWAERLRPIFPNANIDVAANPIETARYDDLAHARFAKPVPDPAPPPEAPRMALFLGDLLRRKGVHDLLEAWVEVVRAYPGARIVFAGTGAAAELAARASALGIAHAIELPGWVELETKRRLLGSADVFVLPSYIEGVPISLLEAMAAGLPSVVTPAGGVLDTVTDGREVLIVPAGDPSAVARAVIRLFDSPAESRRLAIAAHARAAEFDIEVYVDRLAGSYERIIARSPRRGRKPPGEVR